MQATSPKTPTAVRIHVASVIAIRQRFAHSLFIIAYQRTGEDTGYDNTYDGRYDALGTGNDIIDRAGQSGAADKAAAFHRDCDMSELVRQALDQFFA